MKKTLLLLIGLFLGFGVKAQCPLTQAVDFTATDVHGTEVHLFDILDGGQYVLIDFFFTTCNPCQQATPKVVESYYAMGCNQHDVFYMEIATGDSDAACLNWVSNYGVEYPTISGAAGGTSICGQYAIDAYPTLILIAPDRSIVIHDLWPISNAQTVIAALEQHGLEQHECGEVPTECDVPANLTALQETEGIVLAWDAVETAQSYNVFRNNELLANVTESAYTDVNLDYLNEYCYTVTSICEADLESDHSNEACATYYVETLTFSTATIHVDPLDVAWITVYNNTADDATVTRIQDEPCSLMFTFDGEEMFHAFNSPEFTIPQGESIELGLYLDEIAKLIAPETITLSGNFPDASFVAMVNHPLSINENKTHFVVSPNPANDFVTLKGENLGTVSVFNALGQKVEEFETNGNELRFGVGHYENGIYYLRAGKQTMKFVVRH